MHITVINGSPRANGNTGIMVSEFQRGAEEVGHEVNVIQLMGKLVHGCLGCRYCCAHEGNCIQKDDMTRIYQSIDSSDMLVIASPIYWFDLTAQVKAVIDRLYARVITGFPFKKMALLLDGSVEGVFEAPIMQYKTLAKYMHLEDCGVIAIPNMNELGAMRNSPKLKEVYELGRNLK